MTMNMRKMMVLVALMWVAVAVQAATQEELRERIKQHCYADYKQMYRQPEGGALIYPYLTPGSRQYARVLWDWDSWLSDVALRQILADTGSEGDKREALVYEQGCVLNYLAYTSEADGYMPMVVDAESDPAKMKPKDIYATNMHKPVIAQHAAFITQQGGGDASWLREGFGRMQAFVRNYQQHHRHEATGLFYWQDDLAIGVDNDPSTFFRPKGSSASIYLNCLMVRELQAMAYLAGRLEMAEAARQYEADAEALREAVRTHCWDEKDGMYYSVDLNLLPYTGEPQIIFGKPFVLHKGAPRDYPCLIQRLGSWSGFMALWAGIATQEQAERMVRENLLDERTFWAPYGVRTLSKLEKMYNLRATNNPSNWQGPIWGISNYMVFRGLADYGFDEEARQMAEKTIALFGNDLEREGALHEYYNPETGAPIMNKGFQNWNYLVLNMIAWVEDRPVVREFAAASSAQQYQVPVSEDHEQMLTGRFEPTWESLETHQTPEWFRDAKFGIWAHWGPQCVEGSGDWMARGMYQEGSGQYKYHVEHYGHPSEVGFKDILPLFKAERWDPEALVERYKRCGAQYFFVLGNHHDNYDLWDSQYQPWNSKNIGPKRDILDGWAKAAKKAGLPLGISFHADHAWTWYEPAQRYDMNGKKAGVYYDGRSKKEDGKGKWWEGLDPQMLYQQNHPMSERSWSNSQIHRQWDWSNGACPPSEEFVTNFYDRTLDAINRYEPDLIYFDVTVLPFYPVSDCGLKIATHMYNKNPRAVVFGKILSDAQKKALTWDVERGAPNQIMPEAWQTCNCIGGWHYNTGIYENGRYKSAAQVVKQLVDIVSKNGNLLLSIPLRADGTYDEKEAAILDDLEAWMTVNKESILGTRPWVKFGEGPVAEKDIKINAQGFNDGQFAGMDYRDIRFNQTKNALYVTAMGWPEDGRLVVKSLAKGNKDFRKTITSVTLLGYGRLKVQQTSEGLVVNLPKPVNKIAPVLKITK